MRHRTWKPVAHGMYPGVDYGGPRPFEWWPSAHLDALIGGWLQLDPPCLELATLALTELETRGDDLKAALKFAGAELAPISWLAAAREAVREKLVPDSEIKGRPGHVYVVLRGGYTEGNGWYGAYVGSTRKPVEKRFLEHRRGVRAGRGLQRHGVELLYSLFAPVNPVLGPKKLLMEWETRLHEAIAPVVPKVTGDVAF